MAKHRILVTVKTYPTLSAKYGETVCTAGVRSDGSWVRVYPVPFRRFDEDQQYSKYDWLDLELIPNSSDPRPESFRPAGDAVFVAVDHMGTEGNWRERRRLLLETSRDYTRLADLIADAKANVAEAIAKVRQKYFDQFLTTDLHFFMGTTLQFHFVAPNPWVIVGVFQIPHERQRSLFE